MYLHTFLASALDGPKGQLFAPVTLLPTKEVHLR